MYAQPPIDEKREVTNENSEFKESESATCMSSYPLSNEMCATTKMSHNVSLEERERKSVFTAGMAHCEVKVHNRLEMWKDSVSEEENYSSSQAMLIS